MHMYNVYLKDSGEKMAEFTPGGPGCNFFGGVAIDVANPPATIETEHCIARLNPAWEGKS